MTNNPNNVKLSACRVRWGGRDLGLTKGGVDVTIKTDTKMVQVDQFGTSPINEYITGRTVTIKTPFAETDLDTFYSIMRQIGGSMSDNGVAATGTLTFSAVPVANDTVTVNGHKFTFVTTAPAVDQVKIGGSIAATITNLVNALQLCSDVLVESGVYVGTATTVVITYFRSGTVGNAFTLAEVSTAITSSGATLTGGTDSTSRHVTVSSGVGISMLSTALPLVLHPRINADNDTSEDLVVGLAATSGNVTFSYKFDTERVFIIEFTGYPDPVTGQLYTYGN